MQWHMPIGYKVVDGKITICEEQRKIVEQIFTDYDSGVAAGRIAQNLKGRKICNAKGKVSWTHASIGRILENPSYLGTDYYPQLIGEELFERVQCRREKVRAELGRADHRPGVQNAGQYAAIFSRGIRIEAVSQDGDVKTIRLAEQKTAGTVLLQTGRQSRCVWKPSMQ